MSILNMVKLRCAIPSRVTVYDAEIRQLIIDAIMDMITAGVPARILPDPETISEETEGEPDQRVLTCITLYVQAYRGQDRTDTELYIRMYRNKLHKLMLEPEEE